MTETAAAASLFPVAAAEYRATNGVQVGVQFMRGLIRSLAI